MDFGLNHKFALVTGSNRGTGLVIAGTLAAEGVNVIYHSIEEGASQSSAPDSSLTCWGDIRTDTGAEQVFTQVSKHTESIDILVNKARQQGEPGMMRTRMPGMRFMTSTPFQSCAWCNALRPA